MNAPSSPDSGNKPNHPDGGSDEESVSSRPAFRDGTSQRLEKLRRVDAQDGRYQLEGEIGRGGMGAVLKIFDTELRRHLAMKVELQAVANDAASDSEADRRMLARFLEEAQVTSQLDHPGIVPVHEMGVDAEGRVYFTMQLVKGEDLSKVYKKVHAGHAEWSIPRVLGVLLKVCEAMSYAHEKGVVHRDLKPANIMVGRHGEVYVMDWGLARVGDQPGVDDPSPDVDALSATLIESDRRDARQEPHSPLLTMDGSALGTPYYMAPEQAAGRLNELGAHSDVYALGALLYHLLGGRMPYYTPGDQVSPHTVLAQVLQGPPEPLTKLAPEAPPELVSICEKAMAREVDQRYADMGELGRDLRAFLEHRVVDAYRTGAVVELKKWIQRNKGLAGTLAVLVLVSVVGSSSAALVFRAKNEQIRFARDEAIAARELAGARAAKLEVVARFQAERLGALDVERMGAQLRKSLLDAVPEPRRPDLVRAVAGINFTSLALGSLERELFEQSLSAIDEEFGDQPLVQARLLQSLATTLRRLGLLDAAEEPQESALALRREHLGVSDPETLESEAALGALAFASGAHADAEVSWTRVLQARRGALGQEHPDTIESIHAMGRLRWAQGRHAESETFLEEALAVARRTLGDEHPTTLRITSDLALTHAVVKSAEQAEALFRETLQAQRRTLGSDHPDTHATLDALARFLAAESQPAAAEPLVRETLERHRLALGDDHPTTLRSLNTLGSLLGVLGRFDEAESTLLAVMESRRRVLGDDHAETLSSINNLGMMRWAVGQLDEARPFLLHAFEGQRRLLGSEHLTVDSMRQSVRSLLRGLLDAARNGDDPTRLHRALAEFGAFQLLHEELEEAEALLSEALDGLQEDADDGRSLLRWSVQGDLAATMAAQGRFDECEPLLLDAADALSERSDAQVLVATEAGLRTAWESPCERVVRQLIEMYERWHQAEPDGGYLDEAVEWRATLEALPRDE